MKFPRLKARMDGYWRRIRRFFLEWWMTETYPLAVLEGYAEQRGIPARKLVPSAIKASRPPIFIRSDDLCDISGYDGTEPAPEINLFEIEGVTAIGRTEFLLRDGLALYPSVIDPASDAFMMELENRGSVDLAAGKVHVFPRGHVLRADRAISLLGQCNGNYAHWVTEVLARFVLIEEHPEYRGWPILVDHPVHEKLLDALDFLNVSRHRVINVLPYQKVVVGTLVYITPPSMTPPETREFFEKNTLAPPRKEQFHFSDVALAKLRERTAAMAQDCLVSPKTEAPWNEPPATMTKRIFLRREAWTTGNGRLMSNADVVEQALEEFGFTGVNIADFSFEGQVLTAREIEIVVSPIGAALTNLVFRDPGCIVIILTPHYEGATFFYFANLMAALGHDLIFVLGAQTRHGGDTVYNRNFRISIRLLRQAVRHAIEIVHDRKTSVRPSLELVSLKKASSQ